MNNFQLERYLKKYHVKVTCADELPRIFKKNKCRFWVVNTDRCGGRGIHWVAFHFPLRGPAEFFDSLGNSPEYYNTRFRYILTINGPRYQYSTSRIQSETSSVCGHYCIYFIEKRNKGFSMKNIMHDFSVSRLHENDRLVSDYVKQLHQ